MLTLGGWVVTGRSIRWVSECNGLSLDQMRLICENSVSYILAICAPYKVYFNKKFFKKLKTKEQKLVPIKHIALYLAHSKPAMEVRWYCRPCRAKHRARYAAYWRLK